MKIVLFFFILIALSSCTLTSKIENAPIQLHVLNYGISNAKVLYEVKNKEIATNYKLNVLEKTDTIVLSRGVQFGIEYFIESASTRPITVKIVWTYPSNMTNSQFHLIEKKSYEIEKLTNHYSFSKYTLETDYEMLPGTWNLKIFHEGQTLLDKDFHLVEKSK